MSETAPVAPAASAPAEKTPVKKKAKKAGVAAGKRKASGPPVSELITKAVAASKERSGLSLAALKKALAAAGYDVEKNNSRIKLGLKSLVSKGTLVQTKGTGASGSFKLNKKAASGEAKPKAKKAGAAKPKRAAGTAKKPKKAAGTGTPKKSAKKTPKKAKKPAAAAVTKKVAKSPKKAKAAKPKKATKAKAPKPKAAKPKAAKPKATTKHGLDVGQDAALRDGHAAQQLVELLVVADGQLQVARDDARLLVVAGRVARQLQDLGRQVLQHGRQVHRRARPDPLRVVALAEQAVDAAHRELEPGPRRARLGLGASLAALLSPTRHFKQTAVRVSTQMLCLGGGRGRKKIFIRSAGMSQQSIPLVKICLSLNPIGKENVNP
uniref:H15 domain-containing protein n=1 Tax=Canis lupus familiaris TaxID=9615 RepID=A0A8C0NZE8_CANLF